MLATMRRGEAETGRPDSALVECARAGDPQAFEELMQVHLQHVWRVVWRILRHREDTEDVVQEVFLSAHQSLGSYRAEARFSTWLHRIAVNRALNYRDLAAERMRRASRSLDPQGDEPDTGPAPFPAPVASNASPLKELEMKELQSRLAECMKRIPATWRAAIALRDGESMSYQEIADAVGIALGTVRSRLARARMALRRCVEGEAS